MWFRVNIWAVWFFPLGFCIRQSRVQYIHYSSVPGITYRGRHHQMCPKSIPKSIHTNLVNRNPIVHLSFGDFGGVMQALFLSFWGTTKGCPLFSFEGKSYISKHYIIISFCWNFQFLSFFLSNQVIWCAKSLNATPVHRYTGTLVYSFCIFLKGYGW